MCVTQGEERKQVIHLFTHTFAHSFIYSGCIASLPAVLASSASYPFTSALAPLKNANNYSTYSSGHES